MQKLYSNILETIGNTPIVQVQSLGVQNVWAKLEFFNPAGSIKDRVAYNMLKEALREGVITKETVIVEPTSGNTGVGLAFCAAAMGLKFIAVMPENMSEERKKLIKAYGAQLVLTPKAKGMQGAVDKANELVKEFGCYMPMQFENKYNPAIHYATTAEEIYEQTEGKIDILVAGIGTGGTITGAGKRLKELNPHIITIGVEAAESPLLTQGSAGAHKIQGISANFVPEILNRQYVDEIFDVKGDDAIKTAREIAHEEGLLVGISSGAVLFAMKEIAQRYENKQGKAPMIVGILADNGERYLSGELYDD